MVAALMPGLTKFCSDPKVQANASRHGLNGRDNEYQQRPRNGGLVFAG